MCLAEISRNPSVSLHNSPSHAAQIYSVVLLHMDSRNLGCPHFTDEELVSNYDYQLEDVPRSDEGLRFIHSVPKFIENEPCKGTDLSGLVVNCLLLLHLIQC